MISPSSTVASSASTLPDPAVPERLRLAPGRAALWRSPTCLQLGLDDQRECSE